MDELARKISSIRENIAYLNEYYDSLGIPASAPSRLSRGIRIPNASTSLLLKVAELRGRQRPLQISLESDDDEVDLSNSTSGNGGSTNANDGQRRDDSDMEYATADRQDNDFGSVNDGTVEQGNVNCPRRAIPAAAYGRSIFAAYPQISTLVKQLPDVNSHEKPLPSHRIFEAKRHASSVFSPWSDSAASPPGHLSLPKEPKNNLTPIQRTLLRNRLLHAEMSGDHSTPFDQPDTPTVNTMNDNHSILFDYLNTTAVNATNDNHSIFFDHLNTTATNDNHSILFDHLNTTVANNNCSILFDHLETTAANATEDLGASFIECQTPRVASRSSLRPFGTAHISESSSSPERQLQTPELSTFDRLHSAEKTCSRDHDQPVVTKNSERLSKQEHNDKADLATSDGIWSSTQTLETERHDPDIQSTAPLGFLSPHSPILQGHEHNGTDVADDVASLDDNANANLVDTSQRVVRLSSSSSSSVEPVQSDPNLPRCGTSPRRARRSQSASTIDSPSPIRTRAARRARALRKKPTAEYVLVPPKIVRAPSATAVSTSNDRPRRNRAQPARFWLGERAQYKTDDQGNRTLRGYTKVVCKGKAL